MRILITGASGFVGSHLIAHLKSNENKITGTYYPKTSGNEPHIPGTDLVFLDIRKDKDMVRLIKDVRPNWVFHLAAISNVRHSWQARRETIETNILGTFNLFEALKEYSPKARVLFISSSDVYGNRPGSGDPYREEDPGYPVNPYAYSKLSGESLCRFYSDIEGMDVVVARSFPHTGPGQSSDFVCSDWANQVAQIEKGKIDPILQVGNLSVERDFLDVRDVVRAYAGLLSHGKRGELYNVCSGKAVALRKILHLLLSFSPESVEVRVDSDKLRKTDIPLLVGTNEKISQTISWKPQIPLRVTLKDLLDFWRQSL
ncbi:GDP-mannose 4,6-dehydratase [Acidobacteriota bacterium]